MMADMPTDFWSGWIILLSLTGFSGLAWLVLSVYRMPAAPQHEAEPVWDENLREGNTAAPFWWFWLILAAMVFSVTYLMLYPGLGSFAGAFKWSQGGQLKDHELAFAGEFSAYRSELLEKTLPQLAADPVAMQAADRLFREHCSACHGVEASGQAKLFPNLRDTDWLWGGTAADIEQTIRNGRTAAMISWQAVLGDDGVNNVADYVVLMSAGAIPAEHPGQVTYQQFCFACHGPTGDGNPLLGAPRLNDSIWLYGGDKSSIQASIALGRSGQMPAFASRLDDLQIRLLVAWLQQQ